MDDKLIRIASMHEALVERDGHQGMPVIEVFRSPKVFFLSNNPRLVGSRAHDMHGYKYSYYHGPLNDVLGDRYLKIIKLNTNLYAMNNIIEQYKSYHNGL